MISSDVKSPIYFHMYIYMYIYIFLQDFNDASIIHIYKQKGNWQACDNHCGISLLSILSKILARVFLNHLNYQLKHELLPESQCGFRNELDMVSRDGLWKIMAKYGYPETFFSIIRQFHDGMHARVQDHGESSVAFPITNGVKQGCILAPTLFSIMFSVMLFDAFSGLDNGSDIWYHTDGSVFNLIRLQAKTKVKTDIVYVLLFTDDYALNATTKARMQNSVDKFLMACDNFGLTITTKKTEVMHQLTPRKSYVDPIIAIKGQRLKVVEKFTYLGSTLSKSIVMDDKVNTILWPTPGMCGSREASQKQPKSRYTKLSFLPPYFMTVKHG